ncbi:MAG TPA: DNA polymerase ligase N-terminal domain-containing protein [Acidimicrobiales bacterium]|nr:DNA polymerase ligase N-terminal domain-containing protein [Acidimicrobiales bacterium]
MVAPRAKPGRPLGDYRAKRDFAVTPEPAGGTEHGAEGALRFVVQRHRARRLHYDLRLEMHGVLVSWAVPRGPTLDPSVRTLAVHVEDHPLEYRDFEGVIPGGQYGSGDVIVWDRGTYTPYGTDDPAPAVAEGELHVDLHGEKLRGRFVLVRTRPDRVGREQWLLLHKHDEFARPGWRPEDHPRSVLSGRTNEEVAADPDALWHGGRPPAEAEERLPHGGGDPPPPRGGRAAGTTAPPRPRPAAPRTGTRARPDPPAASDGAASDGAASDGAQGRGADEDELAALDALGAGGTWDLAGRTLKLTNLDKALFPGREGEPPATKRDLVRYYVSLAPYLLPYLRDRPLNMHRFPNGVDRPGFWHKQVPAHAPEWLTRWHDPDAGEGKSDSYVVADHVATLAWLANFGAVELHPWTSRLPDVHRPTWALIDIDPGTATTFDQVVLLAKVFHAGLEHLGVTGLPKVTGQRGIHVWVPIEGDYSFDDTRAWVEQLSRAVGGVVPDLVSWTWEKRARHGLARLDFTQNAINKTLVAPYGVRAAPGGPVSVPLEWDELDTPGLRPDGWTMRTVGRRVAERGDPYRTLLAHPQRLPPL